MIVIMESDSTEQELNEILDLIHGEDFETHLSQGVEKTIVGLIGDSKGKEQMQERLLSYDQVEKVVPVMEPYKLTSWKFTPKKTVIEIDGVKIGAEKPVVMAGPCSVESEEQILHTARIVADGGAEVLRGGAFKPRTSPYSFQGLGKKGLELLALAREETGLKIITELMDTDHTEMVNKYTDIIQIGSRNMKNYALLKEVGKLNTPVMLKRGMASTVKDWLLAAEYIMSEGNQEVMLCERGIKTFCEETRYTMDLSAIPLVREKSHLPVIADPSHGTGRWELVAPMARAAIAAGADGLLVEVHPQPKQALSDGPQSLKPDRFSEMMKEINIMSHGLRDINKKPGLTG